jgi:hypothetical protein
MLTSISLKGPNKSTFMSKIILTTLFFASKFSPFCEKETHKKKRTKVPTNINKGFFGIKNLHSPDFYHRLQHVATIQKDFFKNLLSDLLCNHFWLNLVVNDHQFGNITELNEYIYIYI